MENKKKIDITKEGEDLKYTEQQLQTWTAPLSKTEEERAENTIKMVKFAIEGFDRLKSMNIDVFTQGSFANNTNVRSDSDVDVCVMLKDTFHCEYPDNLKNNDYGYKTSEFTFQEYRELVKKALQDKFGTKYVYEGNKSLKINENTYHVKADVVPAFQLRNYAYKKSVYADSYVEGIWFQSKSGKNICNYPKVHINNGTGKNNRTNYKYKKLVRIMKHIKNAMVDDNKTDGDKITSFLIECLVWNTPDRIITGYNTWTETVRQTIIYLYNAIKNNEHKGWGEVSEMLYLFIGRKWTDQDAKQWLSDVWNYMGYNE